MRVSLLGHVGHPLEPIAGVFGPVERAGTQLASSPHLAPPHFAHYFCILDRVEEDVVFDVVVIVVSASAHEDDVGLQIEGQRAVEGGEEGEAVLAETKGLLGLLVVGLERVHDDVGTGDAGFVGENLGAAELGLALDDLAVGAGLAEEVDAALRDGLLPLVAGVDLFQFEHAFAGVCNLSRRRSTTHY